MSISRNDNLGAAVAASIAPLPWINPKQPVYGAVGDGVTDDTAALQSALAAGDRVWFPDGTYKISDALTLDNNHHIMLGPGVRINQTATSKNVFKATSKDNVWILGYGAVLYGEGTWSSGWTEVGGHDDRGVEFSGCTRSGIVGVTCKNFGAIGISIIGGSQIKVLFPTIEGTHAYDTVIASNGNFQYGIWVKSDATYGDPDDILIVSPDISGTAQGIVIETRSGRTATDKQISIVAPVIHGIPGQHGLYIMHGKVSVTNPIIDDVELDGIKIQSQATTNDDISGFVVTDFNISNCGSHAVLLQTAGTGSVRNARISGTARDVQRGLGINKKVYDVQADVVVNTPTQIGVFIQGDDVDDVEIRARVRDSGQTGILIQSTNSAGIRLVNPVVRNPGTSAANTHDGIQIASASATVDIENPDVTDTGSKMRNGINNSIAGGSVGIYGRVTATGAQTNAIRTVTTPLRAFPSDATLSGTSGAFSDVTLIESPQPIYVTAQSTSASDVTLWARTLADESAYMVTAEIVGKLSGSAQRGCYVSNVLAYRDGGTATIEGSADTMATTVSASFAGAISWDVTSNTLRLRVNSGGAATYDWKARVTVVPLT